LCKLEKNVEKPPDQKTLSKFIKNPLIEQIKSGRGIIKYLGSLANPTKQVKQQISGLEKQKHIVIKELKEAEEELKYLDNNLQ
jgi:hypothetical protein